MITLVQVGGEERIERTSASVKLKKPPIEMTQLADGQLSERRAISNSDLNEVPTSDRVKGKSKMPVSEREWDRRKEAVAEGMDMGETANASMRNTTMGTQKTSVRG
jgi:hypothetical protein